MNSNLHPSQSTAASSIAEHLSTPSNLSRIPLLRQRIQKERATLQASLSARAKEGVDSVREGLQGLREARYAIEGVKEGMKEVEQTMSDPRGRIEGFGKLLEVSLVHRRFVQALEMVHSLRSMYSRLAYVSDLLTVDSADLLGPAPNLLPIHYHLSELETFRNETLAQARRGQSSAASKRTLEQYFERLGETIEHFESHYFLLAGRLLPLTRAGNAAVAVKIAKIAVVEDSRDDKALEARTMKLGSGASDMTAQHKSMQAEARTIKKYKEKLIDAIHQSCKSSIEESFARHHDDGVAWIEELDWIFDDLALVEKELLSCFPEDWKIHEVYAFAYHKSLYDFLNHYVKTSPDAGSLLRLAQFTKEYKKAMTHELSIPTSVLQPPLLDGKEQELIEVYVTLIVRKMDEWTANLMKTEISDFLDREAQPEVDADDHYGMQGAIILFQMLNQQVDLALDSNQGAILSRVVEEMNRVAKAIQVRWMELLDSELKKTLDKAADSPPGFAEYTIALANDQIKSADFTEAMNLRLEPLVSTKYKSQISDRLNDTMDGYLDVAKKCVQVLIDIIFYDLKSAVKSLLSSEWYNGDHVAEIILTIGDYLLDYQSHLNENLFELLIEDIIDTFLVYYLVAIRKCSKLKIPAAVNKIRDDINRAFAFFVNYKSRKELEGYFDVLESVLKLINSSKMMVYLDYWPFRQKYGVNLAFVEGIMRARDDLDKSAVSDIVESMKRKVASDNASDPETPSIFSRLPIK